MPEEPNPTQEERYCFVIIGYGKKTSYANGKARILDLNETYELLIKPVFDDLGIPCYRAIDKNINGSIDKQMLDDINDAYIAIADISTLNANVMWELGVRHALKPRHTIMICEKAQMSEIPFDVNSFVIHQYTHSEEGIPAREVGRFTKYLTETVTKIINQKPPKNDSPVHTFLGDRLARANTLQQPEVTASQDSPGSFASILQKAEEAKSQRNFGEALQWLKSAREIAESSMTLKDNLPFVISRQALCTYQSKQPDAKTALLKAKEILDVLSPTESQDLEVLGLSGAINKRLFEQTQELPYLDAAIRSYDKGFQLKQDYYNGINGAFMLYRKASLQKEAGDADWEDVKLEADYRRNGVLKVSQQLEADRMNGQDWEEFLDTTEDENFVWALYTIAEAYNYKGNAAKLQEYEEKAARLAKKFGDNFAPASYEEQKKKIEAMMQAFS